MPDLAPSDESLMQATANGDLNAFEEIVKRHQSWAWRTAFRFLGDKDESADMVQEAFLRLLDASHRYKPKAKFRTYFYQIITRLCLDVTKKKKPRYMKDVPETPDSHSDISEQIIHDETAASVRTALHALPFNQRIAIISHYYENMNYHEIASILETTPKAVERLLARGRHRLRTILKDKDNSFCS